MSRWPMVRLGEVCTVEKGGIDPQRDLTTTFAHYSIPAFDAGKTPVFEPGSEIKSQKTRISNKVVLVSKLNPRIPRVWLVNDNHPHQRICSTEFIPLKPNTSRLSDEYLVWCCQSLLESGHVKGSTAAATKSRERAKPGEFINLPIPLPPLPEQRRIVDLLNHAAGIRRLRRQALDTTRQLIPALFVEMFGEPGRNGKGWEVRPLGEIIEGFEGGKNLQPGDESASPYRILKVSAVTSGVFKSWEAKPAPEGYVPPTNHFVRQGDLLFSRANTVDLVGATALVNSQPENLLLPDKLWRFVWKDPSPVIPAYVLALFQSILIRKEMGKLATGTSDSMRNISQGKLKPLPLPVPPLPLQQTFAARVADLQALITQQERHLAQADALLQSLMARYFGGAGNGMGVGAKQASPASPGFEGARHTPGKADESLALPLRKSETGNRAGLKPAPTQDLPIAAEPLPTYISGGQAALPAANQPVPGGIPARLLAAMQSGRNYSRAELLAVTGILEADWTWAIRQLKEEGRVVQEGEKRGARYRRRLRY